MSSTRRVRRTVQRAAAKTVAGKGTVADVVAREERGAMPVGAPPGTVPYGELRSGDKFTFPGSTVLCAKVHQRYIICGKTGSRSLDRHVPVVLVAKFQPRVRKEVDL